MKKILNWIVWPLCFGLAAFAVRYGTEYLNANSSHPGLTGGGKDTFVRAAIDECMKVQLAEPDSRKLGTPVLMKYCGCYANGMAARVSNRDIQVMREKTKEQIVQMMSPHIEAAAEPCIAEIQAAMKQPPSN